jgi:hypothetical protein
MPKRLILSKQSLCYVLGFVWLLDGLLQLQTYMFTSGFAHEVIAPAAGGQPGFVAAAVTWNARLIGSHPVLFDAMFAGVQIALGLGFFIRRAVRLVIISSVAWAVGVWYLGEGLGGLASAHVTALVGAPGAAIIYAILGVAAWPTRSRNQEETTREETTPHETEELGRQRPPQWIIRAWGTLWVGSAFMSCLPGNVHPSDVTSQLLANATSVPVWLSSIDRGLAGAVTSAGSTGTALIVAIELAVGLLAFSHSRLRLVAVYGAMALAALYWAVGQSFGELFSGQATDPSTGPLVIVFGLAVIGAMGREGSRRSADNQVAAIHGPSFSRAAA